MKLMRESLANISIFPGKNLVVTCTSCLSFTAIDLMMMASSAQKSTIILVALDLDTWSIYHQYHEKLSFCRCVFHASPWFLWSPNLFLFRSRKNIFSTNTWGHFYQDLKLTDYIFYLLLASLCLGLKIAGTFCY